MFLGLARKNDKIVDQSGEVHIKRTIPYQNLFIVLHLQLYSVCGCTVLKQIYYYTAVAEIYSMVELLETEELLTQFDGSGISLTLKKNI